MRRSGDIERRRDLIAAALLEHDAGLRAFVRARVPSDEADDILQTAAMRAVERADSLSDPERVRPWLYRIHRNVIVDSARARGRRRRLLDEVEQQACVGAAAAPAPAADESCKCSVSLARKINPAYGTLLALVDAGNATVSEAARTLGITVNNAAVRLHRARAALKKAMLQHCGVSSPADCHDCRCVYDRCCPA